MAETLTLRQAAPVRWAKVVDHTRCIGCHACTTACKSENEVPLGVHRTYVKYVDVGRFPQARRAFQVTRCNQCARAAVRRRLPDGGDAPAPGRHRRLRQAGLHRLQGVHRRLPVRRDLHQPRGPLGGEVQLLRAPARQSASSRRASSSARREAILVGDLNDRHVAGRARSSAASRSRCAGPRRRRGPKLFYKGAHQATLDPLAARRPTGGLFMWSEQGNVPHQVTSGHPGRAEQRGRRDPRLRRAAPRAVGLAGQPLHVDEGRSPPARTSSPRCSCWPASSPPGGPLWPGRLPLVGGRLPRA